MTCRYSTSASKLLNIGERRNNIIAGAWKPQYTLILPQIFVVRPELIPEGIWERASVRTHMNAWLRARDSSPMSL